MKEIDFLPEWYKSGRRRQISYRTQYVALSCVFVAMMVWSFVATHTVKKANAELAQVTSRALGAESASQAFVELKDQVTRLHKKANILEVIDSKIDVASVLAELSFLIDERIVLSKVEFVAERFVGKQGGKPNRGGVVRAAGGNFGGKGALSLGDVRFKVVISGVAADSSEVAELICKLEDSSYFCLVYPSFSRNKKINRFRSKSPGRTGAASVRTYDRVKATAEFGQEDYQASEFEISCYLANYVER